MMTATPSVPQLLLFFILAVHQALQPMKQNRRYIIFEDLDILIYLFALTNLPKHSMILASW
jgi:hypothetical protein